MTAQFLEALTKLSRKIRTAFNARVTAHGLTYPRARTLLQLARKQRMTQSELACELELEQATMVRLLDRMEENDLIRREPDLTDRRVKHIVLTDYGQEQATLVRAIGQKLRDDLFGDIDDHRLRAAVALFSDIDDRLGELEGNHVQK